MYSPRGSQPPSRTLCTVMYSTPFGHLTTTFRSRNPRAMKNNVSFKSLFCMEFGKQFGKVEECGRKPIAYSRCLLEVLLVAMKGDPQVILLPQETFMTFS